MKRFRFIAVLIVCPIILVAQNASPDQQLVTPEEMINRIIELGTIEGGMQKQISKMGDAAAVVITKVFAGRDLTKLDIDMALVILTSSFAGPGSVKIEADRQPRTAFLLLRYLDCSTNDPALKKDIAHTKQYISEQYRKSLTSSD